MRGLIGICIVLSFAACAAVSIRAADGEGAPETVLAAMRERIKADPENPMLRYREAQHLMKLARYDEGYAAAREAMALFVKKGDSLSWMLLESVTTDTVRVDIHFNMGPRERAPAALQFGIVRPLSFRIWSKDGEKLLETIDFEIGMQEGKPATAALGITSGDTHGNFGMLPPDTAYTGIRTRALALIARRHPGEKAVPDADTGGTRKAG